MEIPARGVMCVMCVMCVTCEMWCVWCRVVGFWGGDLDAIALALAVVHHCHRIRQRPLCSAGALHKQ